MLMKRLLTFVLLVSAATAFGQNLLFRSGFEASTTLGGIDPSWVGPNGHDESITGTDLSTGYSWCPNLPFNPTSYCYLHLSPAYQGSYTTDLLSNHFFNSFDTSIKHSGNQSLHLKVDYAGAEGSNCCAQEMMQTSGMNPALTKMYMRVWEYIPASFSSVLATDTTNAYWESQTAWKSTDDARLRLELYSFNKTTLFPHMALDWRGQSSRGETCPYADPISGALVQNDCGSDYMYTNNTSISVPIGQWFEIEVYFVRSHGPDGRFFAAINGQTVADWSGPHYGYYNEEIQDMYYLTLYSILYPQDRYYDDWEIWDAPPCTQLPCGTVTGAGGSGFSGTIPPAFTSYRATIGAVGVPFYYQLKTTHGATSYASNGANLPGGLSLNTSTGLISGTPTGTYSCTPMVKCQRFNAVNSAGEADQWVEFQINSAVQTPIIHDFWATPATGPSTLSWNVMGAGTVTLSINNGVGTINNTNNQAMSGSVTVNPTSTTTYTLTATNSSGSVSKSVTVTVAGSTAPNAPSGLAAIVN